MKKYKIVYVDEVEQFYQEICKGKAFKTVKFNDQKSFDELLTLALNKDEKDLNAQLIIAEIFLLKNELKKEEKTLIYQTALKLANKNDSRGQNLLGKCYYYGIDVEKNNESAIEQFKIAANSSDAFGSYNLWFLSTQGVIDEKEGIDYLFDSAKLGETCAQIIIGEDFLEKKDYENAANWFNKAVKQNERSANIYMEMVEINIFSTFPNVDSNHYDLIDRAESGDIEAEYLLGLSFFYGEATKQNLVYAYMWLKKALVHRHPEAKHYVRKYFADSSIRDYDMKYGKYKYYK